MTKVRATITSKFGKSSYKPISTVECESFMVDSAMDTDTDSWTLSVGDIDRDFRAVLRRDAEVRVQIYCQNEGRVQNLNMGFADEISLDEANVLNFNGRDITAVAVDSQRPPGNFRQVRPQVFVARDAKALKIGDRLKLTKAPPFKKFAVDGSESYWEVWYRLYRKRRMWVWAEPDGSLIAGTLNYNKNPSYFIGGKPGNYGRLMREGWISVERVEIRANKQQPYGRSTSLETVAMFRSCLMPETGQFVIGSNVVKSSCAQRQRMALVKLAVRHGRNCLRARWVLLKSN